MIHKPRKVSKAMRNSNGEIYFIDITEKYQKELSPEKKRHKCLINIQEIFLRHNLPDESPIKFYNYLCNSFGVKNFEILKKSNRHIIQNNVITEKDLLEFVRFIY
jgi:hypothetical protein